MQSSRTKHLTFQPSRLEKMQTAELAKELGKEVAERTPFASFAQVSRWPPEPTETEEGAALAGSSRKPETTFQS